MEAKSLLPSPAFAGALCAGRLYKREKSPSLAKRGYLPAGRQGGDFLKIMSIQLWTP